jgi:hypothetical protein
MELLDTTHKTHTYYGHCDSPFSYWSDTVVKNIFSLPLTGEIGCYSVHLQASSSELVNRVVAYVLFFVVSRFQSMYRSKDVYFDSW